MDFTAFSVGEALFIGLLYWICYLDIEFSWWFGSEVILGLIFGTMYGNVTQGIQIGGQIMLLYIANVAVGANLPADGILACIISMPIALKFGLTTEMAVAIAVPFGIIGVTTDNTRRLIAGMWNRRAYRHVETLDYKALTFDAIWGPILVQLPLRAIPVFAIMLLGGAAAPQILAMLPYWLSHGFQVIGGLLPALGFVRCTLMIGRKNLLPYFLVGYFIMLLFQIPLLTIGIFGAMMAILHIQFTGAVPTTFR